MISIKPYDKTYKALWDDFIERSKNGTFMLKRDYVEYHADRFVDNSLLFFYDDELIALLPLSRHDNVLKSHGGLTFGGFISSANMKQVKMNECVKALIEYLKEHKFKALEYKKYHKFTMKFLLMRTYMRYGDIMLNLPKSSLLQR